MLVYRRLLTTRLHGKAAVTVASVIMIVYRRLLTMHLHGKAAVVANKHLFKAIILKYVHDVIKYTRKH